MRALLARKADPLDLAMARVIVAAHALWILLSRDLPGVAGLPDAIWAEVPSRLRISFGLLPHHPQLARAFYGICAVALLAVVIGIHARVAAFVAAALLFHLAPYDGVFSLVGIGDKGLTLAVIALPILAISRFDAVLAVRPDRSDRPVEAWPLLLVQVLYGQIYLFSGIGKLRSSGLAWAGRANIEHHLIIGALGAQPGVEEIGAFLRARPWLESLVAATLLPFELGFLACVFAPRARWLFVPAAVVFHVGIYLTIGYAFLNLPLLLLFVPWGAAMARGGACRGLDGRSIPSPERRGAGER